ncbi:hypothetical protein T440DRAFT_482862 [Plenodomus tracheiphilus IPT5]|uniref:Uncharacterized protein n=1 Tax=Plenodomus tracheiphilus IPT5 TaxID=1408161 RepID=A0A6A7ATR1_9PLEO|nr:hypothetical protein T440DRAFT_482862 [Plenodomus tracheiphilus IPT5]
MLSQNSSKRNARVSTFVPDNNVPSKRSFDNGSTTEDASSPKASWPTDNAMIGSVRPHPDLLTRFREPSLTHPRYYLLALARRTFHCGKKDVLKMCKESELAHYLSPDFVGLSTAIEVVQCFYRTLDSHKALALRDDLAILRHIPRKTNFRLRILLVQRYVRIAMLAESIEALNFIRNSRLQGAVVTVLWTYHGHWANDITGCRIAPSDDKVVSKDITSFFDMPYEMWTYNMRRFLAQVKPHILLRHWRDDDNAVVPPSQLSVSSHRLDRLVHAMCDDDWNGFTYEQDIDEMEQQTDTEDSEYSDKGSDGDDDEELRAVDNNYRGVGTRDGVIAGYGLLFEGWNARAQHSKMYPTLYNWSIDPTRPVDRDFESSTYSISEYKLEPSALTTRLIGCEDVASYSIVCFPANEKKLNETSPLRLERRGGVERN